MPPRLEKLKGLAPEERSALMLLLLVLPTIGVLVHLLGFQRSRDLLERMTPLPADRKQTNAPVAVDAAHRVARLVSIAARHGPYRATCLRRTLALWWLLRRRGVSTDLRIGVKKDAGDLQAHAWVEHQGEILDDHPRFATGYVAFPPVSRTK